jgi:putative Mg2+ transporter-C (MgtC) family protein
MPVELSWDEVALRLLLTVACATVFGLNREEHGGTAGLRTTILVSLAASVAMIQANLLMPTRGKAEDSFVVLDLMRLPLGILSGVGFLAAGAIFRRTELVVGLTTAAILWMATVIGLALGGGQLALGVAATGIGIVVLWALKWVERYIPRELRAKLILKVSEEGPSSKEVAHLLEEAHCRVERESLSIQHNEQELRYDVCCRTTQSELRAPGFISGLAQRAGVLGIEWRPQGMMDRQ